MVLVMPWYFSRILQRPKVSRRQLTGQNSPLIALALLEESRRKFQGIFPAAFSSCSADGDESTRFQSSLYPVRGILGAIRSGWMRTPGKQCFCFIGCLYMRTLCTEVRLLCQVVL